MRHRKAGRKFGRNSAQRQALIRQLAISMIMHERLTTTEAKAKSLRPVVEKLVTIARSDTQHSRSLVMSKIDNSPATLKLFEVIAPRFDTPGFQSSAYGTAMPRQWRSLSLSRHR